MDKKTATNRVKLLTTLICFVMLFFIILLSVQIIKIKKAESRLSEIQSNNSYVLATEQQLEKEIEYRESEEYKNDLLRQEKSYGQDGDVLVE